MFESEARLLELSNKAVEGLISDEEFAELIQLSTDKRKAREQRATFIANFKETLNKHGIAIQDLFSAADIAAAVGYTSPSLLALTEVVALTRRANAGRVRSQVKDGPILIEILKPGVQGLACRYCKGQKLHYFVAKALKELDDGQLETNLAKYYTPEGQRYFATVEGGVELDRLAKYIKAGKIKPQLK